MIHPSLNPSIHSSVYFCWVVTTCSAEEEALCGFVDIVADAGDESAINADVDADADAVGNDDVAVAEKDGFI